MVFAIKTLVGAVFSISIAYFLIGDLYSAIPIFIGWISVDVVMFLTTRKNIL